MANNFCIEESSFCSFDQAVCSSKMIAPRGSSSSLPNSNFSPVNTCSDSFSNFEDSPLSSPSDIESFQQGEETNHSAEKSANRKAVIRNGAGSLPVGVRLPQRKGGMHLWQFLYSILQLPEKYSHLIEWTSNRTEFEFRLVEPDAIAVWWGYHKNKKNMSYDKLSRSLRYYYDKQIIRKIGGERYVYRFCVDPEVMYRAIGNSENRPKLKPMPKSAENMLIKNQQARNGQSQSHSPSSKTFVVEDPDILSHGSKREHTSAQPIQYPSTIHSYSNRNFPIECSSSMEECSVSLSAKDWQAQEKMSLPYHHDGMYQDMNYLYQLYPQQTTQCLPPALMPTARTYLAEDDGCTPHYITYNEQIVNPPSAIPERSLTSYSEPEPIVSSSSYYPVNPSFVSENDSEFASLPDTITSIATCNEYHSASLPVLLQHEVSNGLFTVYDNPTTASWPLVGSNSASSDFNTW